VEKIKWRSGAKGRCGKRMLLHLAFEAPHTCVVLGESSLHPNTFGQLIFNEMPELAPTQVA